MSSQLSFLLRDHDVVPVDHHYCPAAVLDGELYCCPGGGLCCPDDPLHLVLHFFPATDAADVSLAALGIGSSPPPRRLPGPGYSVHDNAGGGGGARERDSFSVLFADYATDPQSCHAAGATARTPILAAGDLNTCGASPLPALSVSAAQSPPSPTSSSGGLQTTSETGLPPQPQPPPVSLPRPACVVPRKRRRAPIKKLRPWCLDFPLHALPPAAADAAPDNDPGGGGVSRRRRLVARRRNRQTERVCSHCGTPKTPQWRAGPEGPGTLCNACGIRFNQDPEKLKPEYRPLNAPGFRSDQHSNRDRKVRALSEKNAREIALRAMDDDML